jgi:peptidoglycan hydrolase-like protein with peptidoglycan-binding domain
MGLKSPWGRTPDATTSTSSGRAFFDDWRQQNDAARPDTGPDAKSHQQRPRVVVAGLLLAGVAASIILPGASANADPSAHTWLRLRECESSDNYATNTGNGHYGAYQFDLSTWRSVGGSGYPNEASKNEQDARALILYRERGWQPWQCAGILGLRDDADAGSGRISDIHISTGGTSSGSGGSSTSTSGVPAFPGGSHQYFVGDNSPYIKQFQDQMHARGLFPAGTGQYGPKTLAMVKQLQSLNGLAPLGYIGPKTWRLAWTGKYTVPSVARTGTKAAIPAFPAGTHQFFVGEKNQYIRRFQNQMHARGLFPAGTGEYGPKTLAMVKRLQRANGLAPLGYIGPKTWRLAWTGRY